MSKGNVICRSNGSRFGEWTLECPVCGVAADEDCAHVSNRDVVQDAWEIVERAIKEARKHLISEYMQRDLGDGR